MALELFVHGLKFYLKAMSNYYLILDSVRGIEVTIAKLNRVDEFYHLLFDFIIKSLQDDTINENDQVSKNEVSKSSRTDTPSESKQAYLLKFYISVYFQVIYIFFLL
jgi:hypothetical protein